MSRLRPLTAACLCLAAACSDGSEPIAPPGPETDAPAPVALLECRVEVAAATMECAPAVPSPGAGASADLIVGGQGTHVLLANSGTTVGGGAFSTDVTVQNLMAQPLGTADGTTPSPQGVRVFFHSGPTNGVEVANADGTEMYTGPAQPYFEYPGILQPQQVSGARTWSFTLNGATSFSFTVYVVAEVPDETGFLRFVKRRGVAYPQDLRGVWIGEGGVVVAVGDGGFVLRSTDAGETWEPVSSGTSSDLHAVRGRNDGLYAVGTAGTVLRSQDAGATWSPVSAGTQANLLSVWVSGDSVIVVGHRTMRRSLDAGQSWSDATYKNPDYGVDVSFISISGVGPDLVAGGRNLIHQTHDFWDAEVALASSDGGATWAFRRYDYCDESCWEYQVLWREGSLMLVGHSYGILRSANGGGAWQNIILRRGEGNEALPSYPRAIDGTAGLLVAASASEVWRSLDQGATWQSVLRPSYSLKAVAISGDLIISVGASGVIFRSTDGGSTWSRLEGHRDLYGMWGSTGTVIAVGAGAQAWHSADGGTRWARRHPAGHRTLPVIWGVWGRRDTIFAATLSGIYRSTNGGLDWGSGSAPAGRAVAGTDQAVVAVSGGSLYQSTNAGETWSQRASGGSTLRAISASGSTLVAVGSDGTIRRSTDHGLTWSTLSSGTPHHLHGVWNAGGTIVAVGDAGTIRRSVDGGATWAAVTSGTTVTLRAVHGLGATVLAVGDRGTILRSLDAGATWHALGSGVRHNLYGVWILGEREAIVVGQGGLILQARR